MDCFPVHHQLPELTQTLVHRVSDTIQPSHPLSSPSPPFNLSHHQGVFQWVSSSHQVAKALEFQLQHQSFQWIKINSYHSTWSLFVRSHLVILGSIVSGSFWKTKAGMAASHLCTCMLSHFSHVWIFGIPCTVAHKAPLSMYFSHQEYQTGLPFPLPGHLQGIFLTQGWSPPLLCLLLCRWVPLLLSTGEALTFPSDWLLNIKENLFQGSSFFNSSLYFSEPYKWNVDLY